MTDIIHAGIRGAARKKLVNALENELEFKTSGSLKGVRSIDTFGQLNFAEKALLENARNTRGVRYYVVSYKTPIAWVRNDGRIHIVDQNFSVTTSKHQGFLYLLGKGKK